MDVSVVIVNYNVKEFILSCLASLIRHVEQVSFEVIVVDNASSDGSVESIRNHYPQVKLIGNKNNMGFPAANNQGFAVAKGRYILMLNPDTEINDNALLKMKEYMDAHQDISLAGPELLNTNGSHQYSAWRFPSLKNVLASLFYAERYNRGHYYSGLDFTKPFEADSLSGAALFFRSSLLKTVGNLNEYLFWIEDIDFCYRIKKQGRKIVYFPDAKVIHHIGQSARKNYNISISNQVINKIKFYKVHFPGIRMRSVQCISLILVLIRIPLFLFLSPFGKVYIKKLSAYLYTLPRIFTLPSLPGT